MYPVAISIKSGNTTFIENKKSLILHNLFTPKVSDFFYLNPMFVNSIGFQDF
jgi:hypothetical protein